MMKTIPTFIALFFALMSPMYAFAFDTATIEQAEEFGLAIAAGEFHTCVLAKTGVLCWGLNEHGQLNVPQLSHPRQISVGYRHSCALDDFGVKCWGGNQNGVLDVPTLSHPRQIAAGLFHNCALDDSGVKCWGSNYKDGLKVPRLVHPQQISAGGYQSCALDPSGVKCWGERTDPPALSHPLQISSGQDHSCALDDSKIKCWGNNNYARQSDVPILLHPRQLSAGGDNTCALDDFGVKCWGGMVNVPVLSNPRQVATGREHSCALDDSGVICWGNNDKGQLNVPDLKVWLTSFDLFFLEKSYKNLSPYVYRDKKLLMESVAETIERFPISNTNESLVSSKKGMARLLSMYLIEALLRETYSDFIQSKILPKLILSKDSWSKKLGISDIHEIELSSEVLEVTTTLLRSGLQASKNYLSPVKQKELEDLMMSVAQAKSLSELSLGQSAGQLLAALDQHQSLIAALIESERTIGFGKMILEIQSYLRSQSK